MLIPIAREVFMDPLTLLLVPGALGGVLVAFWLAYWSRHSTADPNARRPGDVESSRR
jgi:hypothetical protein